MFLRTPTFGIGKFGRKKLETSLYRKMQKVNHSFFTPEPIRSLEPGSINQYFYSGLTA